ncbi:MAG: hypothetical protein AAF989_16515, partial [Planctomycetota bacterium]
ANYDFDPADSERVARAQAERIAADIVSQGGPAMAFEKQAVALIAYLQRVGVDLFKTPESPEDGETGSESDADPNSKSESSDEENAIQEEESR